MKRPYQLKVTLVLLFLISLLISCGNSNKMPIEDLVNERKLEEFLKKNDRSFIEIIEFIQTERNPSDLIVSYKTDTEYENKRNEVALVNLKKNYYEKIHNVYYTFRFHEAKTLDDFTFISDLTPIPYDPISWYPTLEHWQRDDKKDEFSITTETYIADVSLEELEYEVYRFGNKYEKTETGKLIDINGENGILNLVYRKHDWHVNLTQPETEIRYDKEKERFEVDIKNTSTDITGRGFQGDEYLDSVRISEGYGDDIKLYIYPTDEWDKRFYIESEIVIDIPIEDISIIQTKIILNVDDYEED